MVRGLMTIGSPLNKHIRFWPELFDRYDAARRFPSTRPIPWKNYYDYGDPITNNLQATRDWMVRSKWDRYFAFRDGAKSTTSASPVTTSRAAQNDYWRDTEVFGHFIQAVGSRPDRTPPCCRRREGKRYEVPGSKGLAWVTSYPLPYVLSVAILFLACYPLYKAVHGCLDPIGPRFEIPGRSLDNVLGLCGLVAAM